MIKLVVIDFDDTLCLTEQSCFKLENFIAQKMGFAPMTREVHIKNWGNALEEAILERIPGINANLFMEELEIILPKFIENSELDVISDINLKTLEAIRGKKIKTAILTSRTLGEVKHLLDEKHPLNSRIDAFYHKDNSDYIKPNPKVYDKVLRQFRVKPDEAVYVGDSLNDAISAKEAGLHFIALLESGLRTKEDFKDVAVDYFAPTFEDILNYVEKY